MHQAIRTLLVSLVAVVAGFAPADAQSLAPLDEIPVAREVPVVPSDNGSAVQGLLLARQFTLTTPFQYSWTKERPAVSEGTILVLEVDPEFVRPRQVFVPVIYVGDKPAMVVNQGYDTGRLVVVVPGAVDLTVTPVYFGSFELPELVDAARGREELAAAKQMGLGPFAPELIERATRVGGEALETSDLPFLMLDLADLVLTYCPDEVDLALGLSMAVGQ